MRMVEVFLGKVNIRLHHVHVAMPQEISENKTIAIIANELYGECVPKAMAVGLWHTRPFGNAFNNAVY